MRERVCMWILFECVASCDDHNYYQPPNTTTINYSSSYSTRIYNLIL